VEWAEKPLPVSWNVRQFVLARETAETVMWGVDAAETVPPVVNRPSKRARHVSVLANPIFSV